MFKEQMRLILMFFKHKVGLLKSNEIFMNISSFETQRIAHKRTKQRCIRLAAGSAS